VEEIAQLTGATELRIWHDQIQYKDRSDGGVNMCTRIAYWPILTPKDGTGHGMDCRWTMSTRKNGCMSMLWVLTNGDEY